MESSKILAAWDKGVRTEEEWLRDQGMEEEKGEQAEQELQFMLKTEMRRILKSNNNLMCIWKKVLSKLLHNGVHCLLQ